MDERIMMAIVRVSELFKRKSSSIFARYGLSFSQYNVLRVLGGAGGGQGTVTDVSTRLLVSTPNLSGIAKRLEKGGFISRRRDAADERRTILVLEPLGRRVMDDIGDLQDTNIQTFLAGCPLDQKQAMLDLLKTMLKLED